MTLVSGQGGYEMASEALDIRELLACTPQRRAERLSKLLEAGAETPEARTKAIARGVLSALLPLPLEQVPADYKSALPMLRDHYREFLHEIGDALAAHIREGTGAALAWANDERRQAVTALGERTAARKEIETRIASLPPLPTDSAALEAQRSKLEQELGSTRQQNAEYQHRESLRREASEEVQEARAALEEARQALLSFPAPKCDAEALRKRMKELRDTAEIASNPPEVPSTATLETKISVLMGRLENVKADAWRVVAVIGQRVAKSRSERMRRDGNHLQALAAKHGSGGDTLEGLDAEIATLNGELDAQKAKIRKIKDARAAMEAERRKATDALRALQADLDAVNNHEAALNSVKYREDLLAKAERRLQDLDLVAQPKESRNYVAGLQEKIAGIKAQIATVASYSAIRAELALIISSIRDAETGRDVYAAIESACQRQREAEVNKAGGGGTFMEVMRTFLSAAGRAEEPYIRAARATCEIGWRRSGGEEIPIEVLSGGEWCLFAAALAAAVIIVRDAQERILIVEAGETDDVTANALASGISALEGRLTCAVMCLQRVLVHHGVWRGEWTVVAL
jgi:hypothetical protein